MRQSEGPRPDAGNSLWRRATRAVIQWQIIRLTKRLSVRPVCVKQSPRENIICDQRQSSCDE